jgi:hypothetical protein
MTKFVDNLNWEDMVVCDANGNACRINIADYVAGPAEVKVVRLNAGSQVPTHSHSANVVHLVLSGELEVSGKKFGPLADYKCGGWEYQAKAVEDTIMLLIQPQGTTFRFPDTSGDPQRERNG